MAHTNSGIIRCSCCNKDSSWSLTYWPNSSNQIRIKIRNQQLLFPIMKRELVMVVSSMSMNMSNAGLGLALNEKLSCWKSGSRTSVTER